MTSESNKRIMAAIILPLLLCLVATAWYQLQLDDQRKRNNYLIKQVSQVDEELADLGNIFNLKKDVLERLHIIQLVGSAAHFGPVHILNDISHELPKGISIKSIRLLNKKFILEGEAISKEPVQALLDGLLSRSYLSMKSEDDLYFGTIGDSINFKLILNMARSNVDNMGAS